MINKIMIIIINPDIKMFLTVAICQARLLLKTLMVYTGSDGEC